MEVKGVSVSQIERVTGINKQLFEMWVLNQPKGSISYFYAQNNAGMKEMVLYANQNITMIVERFKHYRSRKGCHKVWG